MASRGKKLCTLSHLFFLIQEDDFSSSSEIAVPARMGKEIEMFFPPQSSPHPISALYVTVAGVCTHVTLC